MKFVAWCQTQWTQHGTKALGALTGFVGLMQEIVEVASDDIPVAWRHTAHLVTVALAFIVIKRGFTNTSRQPPP